MAWLCWEHGKTGGGDRVKARPAHRRKVWGCAPRVSSIPRSGWRGPDLLEVWSVLARPDCRRFVCDRCRHAVYICSWCDRGQRYCSRSCSVLVRRQSVRAAGRRYQQTRRGRRLHARRQQSYRERRRKKVTHHGCRRPLGSATVSSCVGKRAVKTPRDRSTAPRGSQELRCKRCGHRCEPIVRHDFLRERRKGRVSRAPEDDLAAAGRRDPSPV